MAQNGPDQGQVVQIINCLLLGFSKEQWDKYWTTSIFKIQVLQDHTGCSQDHVHEDAHTEVAKDTDDSPFNSGDHEA